MSFYSKFSIPAHQKILKVTGEIMVPKCVTLNKILVSILSVVQAVYLNEC